MKLCPWCAREPYIFTNMGECGEMRAMALCGGCGSKTHSRTSTDEGQEAAQKASALWDDGQISIPLVIPLPSSAFVIERTVQDASMKTRFFGSRFKVMVPRAHGIANHLMVPLKLMITWEGLTNYRFSLAEGRTVHYNTRLLEYDHSEDDGANFSTFVFESEMSRPDLTGSILLINDKRWLDRVWERPPAYDALYKMIEQS